MPRTVPQRVKTITSRVADTLDGGKQVNPFPLVTQENPMILDPIRAELTRKVADLRSRLPLTAEQSKLYEDLLPLAHSVATNLLKRWKRHRWLEKAELYNEAAIHLADAIREYDPDRSPCIKGWSAKHVRLKLLTWLNNEYRAHDYKSFAPRPKRRKAPRDVRLSDDEGMTAGRWDRYGWHYERPSRRLEIAEIASAVRHCFDSRNVETFAEKEAGTTASDLACKHGIQKSRVYQIVRDVKDFVFRKIDDTDLKVGEVVAVLLENNCEARERAMRLLNIDSEEKSENSITLFEASADYKYRRGERHNAV